MTFVSALVVTSLFAADTPPTTGDDPYLWLEEVQGEESLAWARERNSVSQTQLESVPVFADTKARMLAAFNSKDQIPAITRRGNYFYNFWRDATNPRGLWRRTTLTEYRKAEPQWETILDLDALAKTENENWVWGGANCLEPEHQRCLLWLSRGGADATVVREFDVIARAFVKDGFVLAEAKSGFDWVDANTLLVGTDMGAGSMTKSGYPRTIRRWHRGTPLTDAPIIFEGSESDVSVQADVDRTPGFERIVINRGTDFFNSEHYLLRGIFEKVEAIKLDVPSDATVYFHREWMFLAIKSDYKVGERKYASGALLAMRVDAFLKGERSFDLLFEQSATRSLARAGVSFTRDHLLLNVLDKVTGRLLEVSYVNGKWRARAASIPPLGKLSVSGLYDAFAPDAQSDVYANSYLLNYEDFVTPSSLYLGSVGNDQRELLKSRKAVFDASGIRVEQRMVKSRDGTRIPYFVVWPKGAKANSKNPTLLYGYGGYQISQLPFYSLTYGSGWYRQGGVLVIANIRGGGEFGPAWHQAAMKANKQKSYDDFAAVAEDLIKQKITTPKHLGIYGGSNGGLLVGAVMVQRPELFAAVVCSVPLLDMKRYHLLLAGNSWMAEYGDPDKAEEWAWISKYSPYQNVKKGVKYPKVLFTTSTRDDRVHPGHARKMAAKMLDQGHDVLYYENIEGGHGGAANNAQRAYLFALENAFLWKTLGGK